MQEPLSPHRWQVNHTIRDVDKKSVLAIIGRFRRALLKHGVKEPRIVLFGSWATGEPRGDSDIDLVVISETFEGKDFWERVELLTNAIYEIFGPIEAVALTPDEWEKSDSPIVEFARTGVSV